MTTDTLKTTRVLDLYQNFLSGKLINKEEAAEQYNSTVNDVLSRHCERCNIPLSFQSMPI